MPNTGIELPVNKETGIDKVSTLKVQLDYDKATNKLNAGLREKRLDNLFSPNFLVFIITIFIIFSGIIFMVIEKSVIADVLSFWGIIIPVVTTYIGYAIGKGT